MPQYAMADVPQNTESAQVDDVELHRGGDPVELTDDQAQRLRDAGVVFAGEEEQAPETEPAQVTPAEAEEPHRRRAAHNQREEA